MSTASAGSNSDSSLRQPRDEIKEYEDQRSVAGSESCWRTFDFEMYGRHPPVQRLTVHIPNMQAVYYAAGNERDAVARGPPATTLDMWAFYLRLNLYTRPADCRSLVTNEQQLQTALDCTYVEFPNHHVWSESTKEWTPRHVVFRGGGENRMIGRVYTVHPSAGELYYLRMLLHHVTGLQMTLPDASEADRFRFAGTIEALKFYGANHYPTFQVNYYLIMCIH